MSDTPIYNIDAHVGSVIHIGRQGEYGTTQISFLYKDLFGDNDYTHPQNTGFLLFILQDEFFYPQEVTIDEDSENKRIIWTVTETNTATLGLGKCELVYAEGNIVNNKFETNKILKSFIYDILVTESFLPTKTPTPVENWINEVSGIINVVKNSLINAQIAEQYARGTITDINGDTREVVSGEIGYKDNSKYYKDLANNYQNEARVFRNSANDQVEKIRKISIGNVETGEPGSEAAVTQRETSSGWYLDFSIPQGNGVLIAGTVETYSQLPTASSSSGQTYQVTTTSGNNEAGLYYSNGNNWTYITTTIGTNIILHNWT